MKTDLHQAQIVRTKQVALVGNPNCGKTSIFNSLTGLRQTTANYPGVTVEKKSGLMSFKSDGSFVSILDLPGTYSLSPRSLDEQIVHDVLLGIQKGTACPDLVVIITDASNLERNLYLATQVLETGLPAILVLNMWDLALQNGIQIDVPRLQELLGIPCVPTVACRKRGIEELKALIQKVLFGGENGYSQTKWKLSFPDPVAAEISEIRKIILDETTNRLDGKACGEALRLLSDSYLRGALFKSESVREKLAKQIAESRDRLNQAGIEWSSLETDIRYGQIEAICSEVVVRNSSVGMPISERLDQILTHRVWGFLFFVFFMGVVFQSIFTWAQVPMELISSLIDGAGLFLARLIPDGQLQSLIIDGIVAGVGNVLVFLPQIFLLFLFIALMEDSGYMARAAFVLDRLMKRVGLNGKAFLPLLSSFACAVPGIMATRTIEDRNDRLATILVAPLMSCSARIPVYTLMIGAFIPAVPIAVGLDLKGLTLLSMYLLSIFAGLTAASIFRRTLLKGEKTPFVFELPPYRLPNMKTVLLTMWDRGKEFLYRAGSIIFIISILLWFLSSYPRSGVLETKFKAERHVAQQQLEGPALDEKLSAINRLERAAQIQQSFAGRLGHLIEPVIEPLGFDWKIGIGLISSFAAREVLVSTLAIVYNVGDESNEASVDLVQALRNEKNPVTGRFTYTPLVAVSLMVFFVLACQCMSTIAIVKRETNSWRWPVFMILYMTLLAWCGSFVVFQGGKLMGF